jgi:hypothetical protein
VGSGEEEHLGELPFSKVVEQVLHRVGAQATRVPVRPGGATNRSAAMRWITYSTGPQLNGYNPASQGNIVASLQSVLMSFLWHLPCTHWRRMLRCYLVPSVDLWVRDNLIAIGWNYDLCV